MMENYLKNELYGRVMHDTEIFDFLQEAALDGLWYWNIDNPEDEWMSPRFKELLGYEDEEVPNSAWWWQENILPADLEIVLENFKQHCGNPSHPYDQIVRYRHKNGSIIWVRCRGLALRDKDGRPVRMIGAHTDVTALKLAEEKFKAEAIRTERFNKILLKREERIIEIKKEVNALLLELGRERKYGV